MIGTDLAHYRVTSRLGAGGMGEVWRATDSKLGREVALKVLPEDFADDPERHGRFEREAKVLASLNHPHIATLYGLEHLEGKHVLVMELVEGDGLDEVIARGPIPVDEAIPIALQIAEGLEAAHEAGIVHRDLKPANIRIRRDGTVKVLDFGLAKSWDSEAGSGDLTHSPTLTHHHTRAGVILGTAAYMSPEQAKGAAVDQRADVWAFGVVLWEMLSGRRLFDAPTVPETLANVLTMTPDLGALPGNTPAAVRRVVRRCLARDPKQRLRNLGDARLELVEEPEAPATVPPNERRPVTSWSPWLLATAAVAVAAWSLWLRPTPAPSAVEGHVTVVLPDSAPLVTLEVPGPSEGPLAVSADGRQIVYVAPRGTSTRLFVRSMADLTPRELPGTEGARFPFFSPDGQWVGFFAGGKLRKAPLAGGTPATLADAPDGRGGSWGSDGEIIFARGDYSGLWAVADAGGAARVATTLDLAAGDDSHRWPQILPGRRAVLFSVIRWSRETADIYLGDLDGSPPRPVLEDAVYARFVPSAPASPDGHLLFVRDGALMTAPFDLDRASLTGPPRVIVEGVRQGQFDVSPSGTMAYVTGPGVALVHSLVWVDRRGAATHINELQRQYEDLHLSPDGDRVALTIEEAGSLSAANVWLADVGRGTLARLTFEGSNRDPVWAPDGFSVVFGSKRGETEFGLYRQRVDGRSPAELVWSSPIPIWPDPQSFTPDGRTVIFTTKGPQTSDDIWTLSLDGDRDATPWLATPAAEWAGRLSPDGRFMAYNSDESGRSEVYVRPFPDAGGKWLVSDGGGLNAIWSRDGRELFYRRGDQILRVDVDTGAGFSTSEPEVLFRGRHLETGRDFDVSPDGRRFVMIRNEDPRTTPTFNVILDCRPTLAERSGGGSS